MSRPSDGWQSIRHDVVVRQQRLDDAAEHLLAGDLGDELDFGGGQVDVAGQQVEALDAGLQQHVLGGDVALHEQVVDREVELERVDAEADGQGALRVEVDEQHLEAVFDEGGAEVDGGGGLADPALLVDHGDHARRAVASRARPARGTPGGAAAWGPD